MTLIAMWEVGGRIFSKGRQRNDVSLSGEGVKALGLLRLPLLSGPSFSSAGVGPSPTADAA